MDGTSIQVRVVKKRIEAVDICSFELASVDGDPLPPFSAGSHVDVKIDDAITRQYSLCNNPDERHRYLIGVLRDDRSRGGSKAMHEGVREGDVLEISRPRNHFALTHEATQSLLFAGGIGVTPILCMAERLSAIQADFEMHYCARSPERCAFAGRIGASGFVSRVRFHFDEGDPLQRLDLSNVLSAPTFGRHLYVCGPKGFLDAVLATARAVGWQESHLHCEFFAAGAIDTVRDEGFEVKLASSGKVVSIGKQQTVAQALAAVGVQVPVSCEQGVCGTCLTRVLEGTPDHRDVYLTPQEQALNDQFTPCCSRSLSRRLVLDL